MLPRGLMAALPPVGLSERRRQRKATNARLGSWALCALLGWPSGTASRLGVWAAYLKGENIFLYLLHFGTSSRFLPSKLLELAVPDT